MPEYHVDAFDGPAAAPVVVLLGSLGTTAAVWDAQVPALRPWLRVLRVEHPGHGGAATLAGTASVEALGRRVLGVLDEVGPRRAHLVGLSLGGLVALWLAANHPHRVDRLVLACSAARFNAPETYRDRAVAVRAQGPSHLAPAVLPRWFTRPFNAAHPEVTSRFAQLLAGVDRDGYAFCCEAVARADLRPELANVGAPTLVLGGADDPVVPPTQAAELASAITGAALIVVPRGAHLVNVEQPAAFNRALLDHLLGPAAERGAAARRAVLGDAHVERALAGASPLTAEFQELLAKWPWGEIWARPGLDRHTRRLLTIGLLVALNRPEELEMHIRSALADGVTEAELKEVLLQTALYAGVPAANAAFAIAERATSN